METDAVEAAAVDRVRPYGVRPKRIVHCRENRIEGEDDGTERAIRNTH